MILRGQIFILSYLILKYQISKQIFLAKIKNKIVNIGVYIFLNVVNIYIYTQKKFKNVFLKKKILKCS